MFKKQIIDKAKHHAKAQWPKEAVGIIVDGKYLPQKNISPEPEKSFELPLNAIMAAMENDKLEGVFHSHPFNHQAPGKEIYPYPSAGDMAQQMATSVPWGIVVCDAEMCTDPVWFGDRVPRLPLTERPFRHGVTDCYSLIRDWYFLEKKVLLKDFPREWEWWLSDGEDLYSQGFADAGFVEIPQNEVLPGDVFLARIPRSKVVNHGGIFLGGSGDIILHHLTGQNPVDFTRPAVREPGLRYLQYVAFWLRYEGKNDA